MPKKVARRKLSTTVSEQSYRYLVEKVKSGQASSMAEAADRALERERRLENRFHLARDTAAYFASLNAAHVAEENRLAEDLGRTLDEVDLDG